MKAVKCDTCGKLFMPYLEENNVSKTYNHLRVDTRDIGATVYTMDRYDLCKDCAKSLDIWLESQRDNNAETC